MNVINRIMTSKIITREGNEYEVKFPKSENNFRFFPALAKIAGTTTQGITKLTVDSLILPKELFKQDMMNKFFTLHANVLVGEQNVYLYELCTEIKIANNAYAAQNIKPVDDDLLIEIAPLQIEIPAYKTISFKKIDE